MLMSAIAPHFFNTRAETCLDPEHVANIVQKRCQHNLIRLTALLCSGSGLYRMCSY